MAKRIVLGIVLFLAVALAVACAVPASRYRILALLRDEPLYSGRPIAYWVAALKDSDANVRREAALILEDVQGDFKGRAHRGVREGHTIFHLSQSLFNMKVQA